MTVYRDNIHGSIEIEPYAMLIINTPHFTRLRYLSQLGSTRYIYSSATHSRYEHSIGVYHLTKLLLDVIYSSKKQCHRRLRQLVCIAALCHDLGHGPFSHLFDLLLTAHYPSAPLHEHRSCVIFEDLLKYIRDNHPEEYQTHLSIDSSELEAIRSLILGKLPASEDFRKREYLCRIVSNSVCGIDMDRLDYLLRDSKALGLGVTIDLIELIKSVTLRSIKPKSIGASEGCQQQQSRCVICYPSRLSFEISQIFHTRYSLFKMAYNSPASRSVDAMLKDILTLATDAGFLNLGQVIEEPLTINKLDDRIIYTIRQSLDLLPADNHSELRSLLRRFDVNDFYMVLFSHSFPADAHQHPLGDPSVSCSCKVEFVRYLLSAVMSDEEIRANIIIDACDLHHGKKAANPNLYVPYYNGDFTDITDELMTELFPTLPPSTSTIQHNIVLKPIDAGSQYTDLGIQNSRQFNPGLQDDVSTMELLLIEQNFNVDQRTQDLIEAPDNVLTNSPPQYQSHSQMYSNDDYSAPASTSVDSLIAGYIKASQKKDAESNALETEQRSNVRSYEAQGMLSVSSFQETMINIYLRPSKHSPDFSALLERCLRQIMTAFIRYMRVYNLWFNMLAAIPGDCTKLFTNPQELHIEKKIAYHITGERHLSTPPATRESVRHPFSSASSLNDSDELDEDMPEPHIKYQKP
ncbi:DGTP triphosphohydrolase [Giardia duodenalis]|uniref:dGTP triphosphohydrolase n=1 Tax=Giardia intestinalis (strain ATCC 50803 / WB clone C6) TaxID=184922 RepID=A8BVC9_GIAIC|nr:DGTP triphosphohydrolase [Giardia intestinalis]KAE8302689.1 DGTP triphosphohydrolase [Giardia intestinalis]|eukprot:XP_001704612.1 DGTP triphosphohydrolase [Giardia lamblia ATCC 50803]